MRPCYQIEHYNRALIDQSNWEGEAILNRFELRAMGIAAGIGSTEESIVQRWIERFRAIADGIEARLEAQCQQFNEGLITAFQAREKQTCECRSSDVNSFIKAHADHIYTRSQMVDLLHRFGAHDPKRHADNLIARTRTPFRLYSPKQIMDEIGSMQAALNRFLTS